MTHRTLVFTAATLVFSALAVPGFAQTAPAGQDAPVFADNPGVLAAEMQRLGYRAEVTTDGVGDPKINSSAGGAKFQVYFYGCTDGRGCTSIQFFTAFDTTSGLDMSVVNAWNKDSRYSTAYLDDERDPILFMDIAMHGGLPNVLFARYMSIWEETIPRFKTHIGW